MHYFDFSIEDRTGLLALNRPQSANAYNQPMLSELSAFLDDAGLRQKLGALIVHGGSCRHFCAGADLKELSERTLHDGLNLLARQVFQQLAAYPHPTIAAIHGAALGGGLELALACDLRFGTPDCQLGFPETGRGLIPAAGGCTRASIIAGPALAKEMIIFGRRLNGLEALKHGLLSACLPKEELLLEARRYAATACIHDPLANTLAKSAIDAVWADGSCSLTEGLSQAILYERRRGGHAKH
ncbi:enoyl-CoA hydratase/isomerase family protein [bacterium]|nr:enoyl-CoA hydratase/isomerase family protein [bacterium]